MNSMQKRLAAVGLSVGLVAGGAAGAVLGTTGVSGAQEDPPVAESEERPSAEDRQARAAERLGEVLAPLVSDGTISQEQADAVVARLVEAGPGERGERREGHRERRGENAEELAGLLGITAEELHDALRDGSTIAEVAEANGVDVQTVIDAMVADVTERVAAQVEAGELTQEEADERLAEATERITDRVNNGRPERGGPSPEGD